MLEEKNHLKPSSTTLYRRVQLASYPVWWREGGMHAKTHPETSSNVMYRRVQSASYPLRLIGRGGMQVNTLLKHPSTAF